ncbi:MAG: hypothetical protein R6X02_06565 [Enhygromyxa sp.]
MSAPVEIARGFGPPWFRRALGVVAALFFWTVLANSARVTHGQQWVPDSFRYFARLACLFPSAKIVNIDYRAEGYECGSRRFVELDTRPHFPIRADDKENRFYRTGAFFRRNREVMQALDEYLVYRHNARAALGEVEPIGGIRFSSLRIPLPEPGDEVERYHPKPLSEYPASMRKRWYATPSELIERRCEEWRW